MATAEQRPIGFGRMKRKEDPRFIRGQGKYVDDVVLPGMLHGALLRSPLAHARINSIDTSAAEALEIDGVLDPIQQGFHERHALQCGFCTPGMLMTTRALLDENPDPTDHEIRTAISGAICRCTGYKNIVSAVRWAADHEAAARQES